MSNFREKLTEIVNKTLSSLTEAEDDYVSVASITNTFDPNKNINIYDDENDGLSKDENAEKSKLTKKALDKIKQSLKVTDELQSILNRISKINKNTDYNEWKVNEEDNTAILRNKNAYIFKQNDNLCLSHDNKVEIFKSVPELHKWLCDNNYPLPHNIKLHESVITEDLDFPAIPAGEVIPRHVDDSYALRFKNRYEGTSWDKILRNRWSNIGTKLGNILGISNAQGAKGDISYHTKDVVNDDGTVTIYGKTGKATDAAKAAVKGICEDPEPGTIYNGTVKRIMDFGAFVEILPGKEGLCHISKLSKQRVNKVTDVLTEGQVIPVKLLEVDKQGRLNLSYIDALEN